MAYEIKQSPLDTEPDVAIGIGLPMGTSYGSGFKLTYATIDQAVANSKNLLFTNHGERPMQPTFGCNLAGVLFENNTELFADTVEETIRNSFEFWLPYIFISKLEVTPNVEDLNRITVDLAIALVGNKFDTRSIQFALDGEITN